MISKNIILISVLCVFMYGCRSASHKETQTHYVDELLYESPESFPENVLIDIVSCATEVADSSVVFNFRTEEVMWAFTGLFDRKDSDSFVEVFDKSKFFSGKVYALIALWELDRNRYLECVERLDKERCFGSIFSTSVEVSPFLSIYTLDLITSGVLGLDFVYVPPEKRRERWLRYEALNSFLRKIDNKTVGNNECISVLSSASGVYPYSDSFIEAKCQSISYSILFNMKQDDLFKEVFNLSKYAAAQVYALCGLHELSSDEYPVMKDLLLDEVIPCVLPRINEIPRIQRVNSGKFLAGIEKNVLHDFIEGRAVYENKSEDQIGTEDNQ